VEPRSTPGKDNREARKEKTRGRTRPSHRIAAGTIVASLNRISVKRTGKAPRPQARQTYPKKKTITRAKGDGLVKMVRRKSQTRASKLPGPWEDCLIMASPGARLFPRRHTKEIASERGQCTRSRFTTKRAAPHLAKGDQGTSKKGICLGRQCRRGNGATWMGPSG